MENLSVNYTLLNEKRIHDIKNNIWFYEKIKKRILSAKYGILFNQIYILSFIYTTNENNYI